MFHFSNAKKSRARSPTSTTVFTRIAVSPNMFKALAAVPDLALGITAFLKPLMGEGALVGWYKELIATRVASLNHCEYCVSAHRHPCT